MAILPVRISPSQIAVSGIFLALLSLGISPAGQSIGMGLIVLGGIAESIRTRKWLPRRYLPLMGLFALLFVWLLISFFWSADKARWLGEIRIKLPLLLLPWAIFVLPPLSSRQQKGLSMLFLLAQVGIALLSVGNYLADYEQNLDRVMHNSSLEIFTDVNHIYFGVTLAFALLLGLHLLIHRKQLPTFFKGEIALIALLEIGGLISLHTLTSRTGLVAFYAGIGVYILVLTVRRRAYLLGLGLLAGMILLPLLSMQLIPSFKYRVQVTFWDAEVSQQKGTDLNYMSVGLRLKTWEAAIDLFKEHPITGVGFGDLKKKLFELYEQRELQADRVRWLGSAHNQYLEQLAGGGIVALLLLLGIGLYPLLRKGWPPEELLTAFLALFAASMFTESMLERQLGITFFCLFLYVCMDWESERKE